MTKRNQDPSSPKKLKTFKLGIQRHALEMKVSIPHKEVEIFSEQIFLKKLLL